jgi:hypothetical protein
MQDYSDEYEQEEERDPRDDYRPQEDDPTCPSCGRLINDDNPMISNMRCQECQSMQSLMGEIFLFDGKNPISTILGWFFGK